MDCHAEFDFEGRNRWIAGENPVGRCFQLMEDFHDPTAVGYPSDPFPPLYIGDIFGYGMLTLSLQGDGSLYYVYLNGILGVTETYVPFLPSFVLSFLSCMFLDILDVPPSILPSFLPSRYLVPTTETIGTVILARTDQPRQSSFRFETNHADQPRLNPSLQQNSPILHQRTSFLPKSLGAHKTTGGGGDTMCLDDRDFTPSALGPDGEGEGGLLECGDVQAFYTEMYGNDCSNIEYLQGARSYCTATI